LSKLSIFILGISGAEKVIIAISSLILSTFKVGREIIFSLTISSLISSNFSSIKRFIASFQI